MSRARDEGSANLFRCMSISPSARSPFTKTREAWWAGPQTSTEAGCVRSLSGSYVSGDYAALGFRWMGSKRRLRVGAQVSARPRHKGRRSISEVGHHCARNRRRTAHRVDLLTNEAATSTNSAVNCDLLELHNMFSTIYLITCTPFNPKTNFRQCFKSL